MRVPRHPTNIRRMLESRVKQVAAGKPLLAASLVAIKRRCGSLVATALPVRSIVSIS